MPPTVCRSAGGFRYGSIAFQFNWPEIIKDMRYYWVGAMHYSPVACRILITEEDRHDSLKPYDPSLQDGPWWRSKRTEKNYWNGDYCLEFMLEKELPLTRVGELTFVDHHRKRCSVGYSSCKECGLHGQNAAARLLAGACNRRLLSDHTYLWEKKGKPNNALGLGWLVLRITVTNVMKPSSWGGPIKADSKSEARGGVLSGCRDGGEFPPDIYFLIKCGELGGCLFAPFSEDHEPVLESSGAFSNISFGCKIFAG